MRCRWFPCGLVDGGSPSLVEVAGGHLFMFFYREIFVLVPDESFVFTGGLFGFVLPREFISNEGFSTEEFIWNDG